MKKILEQELEKIKISKEGEDYLNSIAQKTLDNLRAKIKKKGIDASCFVGGSLAKGTLIRKKKQDIDIFVRFDKKYSEEEIAKLFKKLFFWFRIPRERIKKKRQHGSRDYYKIIFKKSGIEVEIVPTVKVSSPKNARNLTDLSYFHVNYVKEKIKKKKNLGDDIKLAKSFAHGQHCYGAESYIQGFSGYVLELLVIYYGSFKKFLEEIAKAKTQIILDPEKKYKSKKEIFDEMNKTKLQSPIVLIDPTFKDRNAARALSGETFRKFQKSAKEFLEHPKEEFFYPKKIDIYLLRERAKEVKGILGILEFSTNKQPGDIAGTKLLKFSKFLKKQVKKYFDIVEWEFDYRGVKKAKIYCVLKRKKEIVFVGPRLEREDAVKRFKEKHKIWYVEDGKVKSARPTDISIKEFLKKFKKDYKKTMKQMSIKRIKII
jgi:tRNA nucleotidyltransferase (CCA-adding enzyme)